MKFYLELGADVAGPLTKKQVRKLIDAYEAGTETRCCPTVGDGTWVTLGDFQWVRRHIRKHNRKNSPDNDDESPWLDILKGLLAIAMLAYMLGGCTGLAMWSGTWSTPHEEKVGWTVFVLWLIGCILIMWRVKKSGGPEIDPPPNRNEPHCAACDGTNLRMQTKQFGAGKAVAGAVIFGPLGILGGFLGGGTEFVC